MDMDIFVITNKCHEKKAATDSHAEKVSLPVCLGSNQFNQILSLVSTSLYVAFSGA